MLGGRMLAAFTRKIHKEAMKFIRKTQMSQFECLPVLKALLHYRLLIHFCLILKAQIHLQKQKWQNTITHVCSWVGITEAPQPPGKSYKLAKHGCVWTREIFIFSAVFRVSPPDLKVQIIHCFLLKAQIIALSLHWYICMYLSSKYAEKSRSEILLCPTC